MSKSNSSLFADLSRIADDKADFDSGPVYLVHAHYSEMGELVALIAKRGEQSVRACVLEYWSERSTDGKRFEAERAKLADTEKRTPEQEATFQRMSKKNNSINMTLERACKVYRGVAFLKSIGIGVDIEKADGSNVYDTYAKRPKVERNDVFFNASQLMRIEEHIPHIAKDAKAVDIRTMLKTNKQGAPNVNKAQGQGERIAPSKIADAVNSLDTSLAAIAQDGGGYAVGPDAKAKLRALWLSLDTTLSDADKALARDESAKLAASAKQAAKPIPNIVAAVKKVVGK